MKTLLIDTDPGVDDALAIMMAQANPDCDIRAIFTVAGNVDVEQTTRNAGHLLDFLDMKIPLFKGASRALVKDSENADYVHGKDGFGDTDLPRPKTRPRKEAAASALIRIANKEPGEHTLVALGPLTNIALALHLDPKLPEKIPRLVIMGGATTGHGNTPRWGAEFNFFADPEAASIVTRYWPGHELVDWELTMRHGIDLAKFESWLAADCLRCQFYQRISRSLMQYIESLGGEHIYAADPMAMVIAMQPDIVSEWQQREIHVETDGIHSRGQTLVDWRHDGGPEHSRIAMKVDQERFETLVKSGFGL